MQGDTEKCSVIDFKHSFSGACIRLALDECNCTTTTTTKKIA